MQFQQRQVDEPVDDEPAVPWLHPEATGRLFVWQAGDNAVTFEPERSDWYVTVDERVGAVFGLVAAPWPTVDANGVLQFGDVTETAWVDSETLQRLVDTGREQTRQTPRPLRVGDAFWVRTPGETFSVERWTAMRDVTAEARTAAKAAVAHVSVGPVDPERLFAADERRPDGEPQGAGDDGPPPPAGPGFASPAV